MRRLVGLGCDPPLFIERLSKRGRDGRATGGPSFLSDLCLYGWHNGNKLWNRSFMRTLFGSRLIE